MPLSSHPTYATLLTSLKPPPKSPFLHPTITLHPSCCMVYKALFISLLKILFLYMKHLEDALRPEKSDEPKASQIPLKSRPKIQPQKWTLDPDNIQESQLQSKERMAFIIEAQLRKKYDCEKYLEEETFRELLRDLSSLFAHSASELQKMLKIEEIVQGLSDTFCGDLKNYLKQFQSLLDAKIRKLKKRGRRSELIEFDRLVANTTQVRRKNEVYFINEDEKGLKYSAKQLKMQDCKNEVSKKSFGTMNSGSNENQSGSGKNKSGSDSKSGESKALAVLLANVDSQEQRKGNKNKQKQRQKYEFTSILNATANIRHRNNSSRMSILNETIEQPPIRNIPDKQQINLDEQQGKDEAFIFHRPKHHKAKP